MKRACLIAPFIALCATGCGLTEPNVYPLPAAEAIARLAAVHVESDPRGPFGAREVTRGRPSADRITFSSSSSHDGRYCEITVSPVDEANSRVDIACNSASAGGGVSSPMEIGQTRKALIELIDSTLEGRPYDHRLARGTTAAGWPKHSLKAG